MLKRIKNIKGSCPNSVRTFFQTLGEATLRNVSHEKTVSRWAKYYNSIGPDGDKTQFEKDLKKYAFTHSWRNSIRIIQEYSGIDNDKDVLDAGCGWGRMLLGLVDLYSGMNITALDYQQEAIDRGCKFIGESPNGNKITWTTGDIQSLPFPDESFDVIYSARVFQHLNFPEKGAAELIRVLRTGGTFVVFLQNKLCPLNITYYSRLYTPCQVKKWFAGKPVSSLRVASMDFFPGLLALTEEFPLCLERVLECIPLLNQFGGKILISGMKSP